MTLETLHTYIENPIIEKQTIIILLLRDEAIGSEVVWRSIFDMLTS